MYNTNKLISNTNIFREPAFYGVLYHIFTLAVIPLIPETELNSLANGRRVYELYADSL